MSRLSEDVVVEQPLLPCTMDWDVYDAQREWEREGVLENGKWRVSYCNDGFRAIETYPDLLVVPSSIDDEVGVVHNTCNSDIPIQFDVRSADTERRRCCWTP